MVILGGWVFLMSEEPLHKRVVHLLLFDFDHAHADLLGVLLQTLNPRTPSDLDAS